MISPDSSRRGGFTLIELLASVGVIAVLSALLFSCRRQGAQQMAESGQCLSNLRRLHIAYMAGSGRKRHDPAVELLHG